MFSVLSIREMFPNDILDESPAVSLYKFEIYKTVLAIAFARIYYSNPPEQLKMKEDEPGLVRIAEALVEFLPHIASPKGNNWCSAEVKRSRFEKEAKQIAAILKFTRHYWTCDPSHRVDLQEKHPSLSNFAELLVIALPHLPRIREMIAAEDLTTFHV